MALIKTGTIGSGTPLLYYELYADQTGASGTKRTVKVTAKLRVNGNTSSSYASWYGYACNWRARVHSSYGNWTAIKGTESWNSSQGLRTFEQTLTVDVGTTSSTGITVGIYTDSQGDNGWDGNATGTFTVGSTNSAPYWNSGASITLRNGSASGSVLTGTIPENVSTIYASWSAGADKEGGTLKYSLNHSVNGGSYSQIDFGTDREHSYSIGSGNEGATYQYYVDIQDNGGLWSSKLYSGKLTKNVMTGATLTSSSSISYSSSSIQFAYSGAKNTNGNTSFTYKLSCNEVTVYNPTLTATPATITIYKSGTVPSGAYIKFDDIKNKFKSANFTGTLTFKLTTTNAYGTSKTSSKVINVDLRTNPNAVSSCAISDDATYSTCIKTTADTKVKYFIPDGTKKIRVAWSGGSCKLGSVVTYDVYVKIGSGAYSKIASNLSSTVLQYDYVCPTQTSSQLITFKIAVKSEFGYTTEKETASATLHYYNAPGITIGNITRTDTTATIPVTVKTNSSIPNINTKGSWYNRLTGATTNLQTGNLTQAQTAQNVSLSSLVSQSTYVLTITYNDGTGFASNVSTNVTIGANLPVVDINKYGLGVNGLKATSTYSLNVKGMARVEGDFSLTGKQTIGGTLAVTGNQTIGGNLTVSGNSKSNIHYFGIETTNNAKIGYHADGCVYISNKNANWFRVWDDGRLTWKGNPVETLSKVNNSSYWGLNVGDGTENGWVRTTATGLLPNVANGSNNNGGSSLGTSTWRFSNIYGSYLNLNGGADITGVVKTTNSFNINNKAKWGVGTNDTYIYNSVSGKYLQFKNDGMLYISDTLVADPSFKLGGKSNAWWNSVITIGKDGISEVGKYLDFHEGSNNTSDYNCRLTSSGGSLVCSGSISQNSDISMKENIVYIDEMIDELIDEPVPAKINLKNAEVDDDTIYPFKKFIKEKLKPAVFNYKKSDINTFGFIAQDIYDSKVGKLFINEYEREVIDKSIEDNDRIVGTEKTLSFDLNGFTTVIGRALQEEIESRDIQILELEEKINKLEEMIKEVTK